LKTSDLSQQFQLYCLKFCSLFINRLYVRCPTEFSATDSEKMSFCAIYKDLIGLGDYYFFMFV